MTARLDASGGARCHRHRRGIALISASLGVFGAVSSRRSPSGVGSCAGF